MKKNILYGDEFLAELKKRKEDEVEHLSNSVVGVDVMCRPHRRTRREIFTAHYEVWCLVETKEGFRNMEFLGLITDLKKKRGRDSFVEMKLSQTLVGKPLSEAIKYFEGGKIALNNFG